MIRALACATLLEVTSSRRVADDVHQNMTSNPTEIWKQKPEDAQVAADYLNHVYFSYDPENTDSAPGLPMTMNSRFKIYCGKKKCYKGWTDCRMPVSMYNHKIQLDEKMNSIKLTRGRATGFVLNPDLVREKFLKCAYMFDGNTSRRFNGGCGCQSEKTTCVRGSAHSNICNSGRKCRKKDRQIQNCACDRGSTKLPNKYGRGPEDQPQCFFKGKAYFSQGKSATVKRVIDNVRGKEHDDQLMEMLRNRYDRQSATEEHDSQKQLWNEVIVDSGLVLNHLKKSPDDVVVAFVYKLGHEMGDEQACKQVQRMKSLYTSMYDVKRDIPILVVDDKTDVTKSNSIFSVASERCR